MVPVEHVRAEAAVVTTTFEAVFAIIFACLVVVALLVFGAYRRRLREQNVAMLGQLYEALSDSIDMAVNLFAHRRQGHSHCGEGRTHHRLSP